MHAGLVRRPAAVAPDCVLLQTDGGVQDGAKVSGKDLPLLCFLSSKRFLNSLLLPTAL